MNLSSQSCPLRNILLIDDSVTGQCSAFAPVSGDMYCLQWLIPVLLIPKPVNPALVNTHVMFMVLYLIGFFLERKPCTVCSVVFLAAVILICYSGIGNCLFWASQCDSEKYDTQPRQEIFQSYLLKCSKCVTIFLLNNSRKMNTNIFALGIYKKKVFVNVYFCKQNILLLLLDLVL